MSPLLEVQKIKFNILQTCYISRFNSNIFVSEQVDWEEEDASEGGSGASDMDEEDDGIPEDQGSDEESSEESEEEDSDESEDKK